MKYKETLDYLFSRLPMYQRVGAAAYKADLTNTIQLCDILDNPQNRFRSIHIAGTNGKGSSSHMLAAVLQEAGYKVGLYTSPHLVDFRERVRINGKMISKKSVTSFVEQYRDKFESINLSFFEWTVGLAFKIFADKQVDIAIIETGLGGRLDSTNVIYPIASLITNISRDHENLLGHGEQNIANEKAGIIKEGVPCVIGEDNELVNEIFKKKAAELNAPFFIAEKEFECINIRYTKKGFLKTDILHKNEFYMKDLKCGLPGLYQKKNIPGVLKIIQLLNERSFHVPERAVKKGIKDVVELTGLKGRWQILGHKPLIVCDTAHNEGGIKQVTRQLEITPYEKLHIVLGMVNDKDISSVLELLPVNATYYFCKASIPRALDEEKLADEAGRFNLLGDVYPTVKQAFIAAIQEASTGDLIYIGGSTFTVADALLCIDEK